MHSNLWTNTVVRQRLFISLIDTINRMWLKLLYASLMRLNHNCHFLYLRQRFAASTQQEEYSIYNKRNLIFLSSAIFD